MKVLPVGTQIALITTVYEEWFPVDSIGYIIESPELSEVWAVFPDASNSDICVAMSWEEADEMFYAVVPRSWLWRFFNEGIS